MEICSRCNERQFQIGLATQGNDIGVCKAYIKDIRNLKSPINPLLFSNSNILNLEPVPKDLPLLTGVEEIMIAYIYIYLQVVCVRGQQH